MRKHWVVFAKPAVQGAERVLDYLGRYVHRTALSDKAITHYDDRSVTFSFTDATDGSPKAMALPPHEFLRRFLQHVPLQGFHRVRAFGLLHSSQRAVLRRLQLLLAPALGAVTPRPERPSRAPRCPRCNRPALVRQRRLSALDCTLLLHAHSTTPAPERARAPPTGVPLQ
jgi:hypothetical protein